MLMYAGFVGESVATHNSFVWLHVEADNLCEQLTRRIELRRNDSICKRQAIGTNVQCHNDLFKGGVTSTFTNAVDGALDLSGASFDGCQTVCYRQAQIVVAVNADDDITVSDDPVFYHLDQMGHLSWRGIADRIRDVEN